MAQIILTFVTRIKPDKVEELRNLLDNEIAKHLLDNPLLPFPSLTRLHFASLVVTEDKTYGDYLVFENNFDGPLNDYLDELYRHAAVGLHRIYSCCVDYPATSASDRARTLAYLRQHIVRPNAYHIGNLGRSVERTKREDGLRDRVEAFLDGVVRQKSNDASVGGVRHKVQGFTRAFPALAWAAQAEPRQTQMERFIPRLKIGIAAVIALVLLPILIPLLIFWVLVLRYKEKRDPSPASFDINEHVGNLVEREDRTRVVQNHMTSITLVKPGSFRRVTLWSLLWLVNLIARTSDKGELSGIPSIHFAHWSMIDKGRRLLFVSNFDGSWENYLDDFIDKASTGLTGIWSNTVGFPRARWLVLDGARDGSLFKANARDKQIYTNVWYSAYPSLTVQTIDNSSAIREQMFASLDEAATREWVWRF